jgi:hypothetical protein
MVDHGRFPAFARALCDDAAVFPPGSMPLADAVAAYGEHRRAPYAGLVGLFVLGAPSLDALGQFLVEPLPVALTAPGGPVQAAEALAKAAGLPVDVQAVEVAVPGGMAPAEFFGALGGRFDGVQVFVEIPRDERRGEVLTGCAATGHRAKFRTGGVVAGLYPDERELAGAIGAAVRAGVPFKATAGLHHAVRNTDPQTGFEQHGFLNVLLATEAALREAGEAEVAALLAERDPVAVAGGVSAWDDDRAAAVREQFLSFGTCSITDPLTELVELGAVPARFLGAKGTPA